MFVQILVYTVKNHDNKIILGQYFIHYEIGKIILLSHKNVFDLHGLVSVLILCTDKHTYYKLAYFLIREHYKLFKPGLKISL